MYIYILYIYTYIVYIYIYILYIYILYIYIYTYILYIYIVYIYISYVCYFLVDFGSPCRIPDSEIASIQISPFFAQICFPLLQLLQKLFVKPAPGEGHTAGGHRWHFVREVIARRALEGDHHAITFLRLGHGVSRKHRIYFNIFHPFMHLE